MRTTLFTILTFALAISLHAKEINWHQGSIVLSNQQVITGEIARVSLDLLIFRNENGQVTTYPAHKISSFRYHDPAQDINRMFIAVKAGKTHKFFERVVYGRVSVLRIQKSFNDIVDETNPESFDFFIEKERQVSPIRNFRKKFFPLIKQELDAHLISYSTLDPNTTLGAVALILLYNQSISPSSIASLN